MASTLPIIRQIARLSLAPQLALMATLVAVAHLAGASK